MTETLISVGADVRLVADPAQVLAVAEVLDDGQLRLTNGIFYLPEEVQVEPTDEQWKFVDGSAETHQVSSYGKVRALYFRGQPRQRLLTPSVNKAGGLTVNLSTPNGVLVVTLASLVARHFLPAPPVLGRAYHVRPLDGNAQNVRADNLAWFDPKEKHDPEVLAYLKRGRGYGTAAAKLSAEQAEQALVLLKDKVSYASIAAQFNVQEGLIKALAQSGGVAKARLSPSLRSKALARLERGDSPSQVARDLNVNRSTIHRLKTK